MVWPVDDLTTLAELFGDVAGADPLSVLLLAVGAAVMAVTMGVATVLALGAVADAIVPTPRAPPRGAE
jgi:hypothetical protein